MFNFPRPTTKKRIAQWCGLASYFQRYIPHYADTTVELSNMLKKNSRFQWTEKAEQDLLEIKKRMDSHPIVRTPDFNLSFCFACDSSNVAIAACYFK